jgi:hypothetical protein
MFEILLSTTPVVSAFRDDTNTIFAAGVGGRQSTSKLAAAVGTFGFAVAAFLRSTTPVVSAFRDDTNTIFAAGAGGRQSNSKLAAAVWIFAFGSRYLSTTLSLGQDTGTFGQMRLDTSDVLGSSL